MIHEKIWAGRVTNRGHSKCKGPEAGIFGKFKKKQFSPCDSSRVGEGESAGQCGGRGGQGQVI